MNGTSHNIRNTYPASSQLCQTLVGLMKPRRWRRPNLYLYRLRPQRREVKRIKKAWNRHLKTTESLSHCAPACRRILWLYPASHIPQYKAARCEWFSFCEDLFSARSELRWTKQLRIGLFQHLLIHVIRDATSRQRRQIRTAAHELHLADLA